MVWLVTSNRRFEMDQRVYFHGNPNEGMDELDLTSCGMKE